MWRTRFVELNGALVAQPIRELGILNMSEDCRLKSCRLALPEGAQPAGFAFDAERKQWILFVQHESFAETPAANP